MKKLFIALLLLLPLYAIGAYTPEQITDKFAQYGYVADQKDISWWGENSRNQWGDLENNLKRRFDNQYGWQPSFGATNPIAGATYNLAGSGVSSSATSITLQSLTLPQTGYEILDADLSDTFYITLEPGNKTRQEIVSCTTVTQNSGSTATLSGCTRGLSPISPYTASSQFRFSHAGGTQVIFSDAPQLFNEYPAKGNNETITGLWVFNQHPVSTSTLGTPTTTYQYITKEYADNLVNQGAATSTESVAGICELATQLEMASSTDYGVNRPLCLQAKYATSTPAVNGLYIPVSQNDGYLDQSWLDLSENFTWTGTQTFSATTTLSNRTIGNTVNAYTASTTITGLTLPQPVYIATSTNANAGGVLLSDANDGNATDFVGFAVSNATAGNTVYIQTRGVVSGFTGLTKGANYYVQDAVGTIATTTGTAEILVGIAISTTEISIRFGAEQFISSSLNNQTSSSVDIPNFADKVIANVTAIESSNGNASGVGQLIVFKKGLTSATFVEVANISAGKTVTITWNSTTNKIDIGGDNGVNDDIDLYFYKK